MRRFTASHFQKFQSLPHKAQWTALIPAAGKGTRLGYTKPKILYPLQGRTILDRLIDLLEPFCSQFLWVLSPEGTKEVASLIKDRLENNYETVPQDTPQGMADAISRAIPHVKTLYTLIIWGDQPAIQPETLERMMVMMESEMKPDVVPLLFEQQDPYIHFSQDAEEKLEKVLQRREGDILPQHGLTDSGVFAFRTEKLKEFFTVFSAESAPRGKETGEWNFLPLLPWFDQQQNSILAYMLPDPNEAKGVNTREEALALEEWLIQKEAASTQEEKKESQKKPLSVVMFSGGRGTGALTEALLRYPDIKLTLLVNAYDDGLSTGLLRRFIPGMLGPSDVRKNLSRFLEPRKDQISETLRFLMEYRFPENTSEEEAVAVMKAYVRYSEQALPHELVEKRELLPLAQLRILARYFDYFTRYYQEKIGSFQETFPFSDMSFGNLIFAGAYLKNNQDFNKTILDLSAFLQVDAESVINITQGEGLILTALKADGRYLHDEVSVQGPQDASKIAEIFLLPRAVSEHELGAYHIDNTRYLRTLETLPKINPKADTMLREADIIIYGPGTQHSSLFPSYLTSGVVEAIIANPEAEKVFIGNIAKDHDILAEDANSLVKGFLFNMGRKVEGIVRCQDVVTRFFFQKPEKLEEHYVSFNAGAFVYPLEKVSWIDLEGEKGKHSGSRTINELLLIIEERLQKKVRHVSQKVSIIVPALNEERTIGKVIQSLQKLQFSGLSLEKEIIVVDGCSQDQTTVIAEELGVRVYQTRRHGGRGEALRLGIEKAKGDLVVFFPSDGEYEVRDILRIITPLLDQEFPVVFGSRAFRDARDLTGTLKRVYGSDQVRYVLSKYGGMLISTLTLFIYHRFVSDPLTSLKAFNRRVFRDMNFSLQGVDFDMELIAKLARTGHVILELPVSYNARTVKEGKKITIPDGLRCLVALLRFSMWSPIHKKYTPHEKSLHSHSGV